MGRSCREIHEWIEEEIEQPIEEWEDRQEERCREEPCNWWMLCLNKLVCWLVWVTVKVIRWVTVTVGKWVVRVVCTVVNVILDVIGFIVGLILSIPIIGGIIRTVLNWLVEIFWRIVGVLDLLGSLVGIRPRKKFYFGVVIPVIGGTPLTTEAALQPQIDAVIDIYDRTCNIDARFTGFCQTEISPPGGSIVVNCDVGGFFEDWWLKGSWFEFVSRICKFESNWRNVIGYGGELIGFAVNNVAPDGGGSSTIGCSFAGTTNWVAIESGVDPATLAHEFGHAFLLGHNNGATNLMAASVTGLPPASLTLTNWQISVIRTSRHVTYL
ncbi:zinc metalloprotease [Marimonas lutisalis]|uniref:hypothetical protein n=1 Tax=Marimonas lutisalis TaxID=2545756 RepID=UPI0010F9CE12|nr:hypothetical protein [Marimonas lutisalis]